MTSLLSTGGAVIYQSFSTTDTQDITAAIGRGYDPIRNQILPTVCVEPVAAPIPLEPGALTTTFFKQVKSGNGSSSASENSFSLGVLVKAVSFAVAHTDADSSYFNQVDSYGRIRSRIATKGSAMTTVRWTGDGRKLLLDKAHPAGFSAMCGTHFVREVYAGHLFDESVRFTLRADSKDAHEGTSLSIGVGNIFGGSIGTGDATSRVSCLASVSIQHNGRGVLGLPRIGAGASPPSSQTPAPASATPVAAVTGSTADPSKPPEAPKPPDPKPPVASVTDCSKVDAPSPLQAAIDYYNDGFTKAVLEDGSKSALPLYIVLARYDDPEFGLPGTASIPKWVDGLADEVQGTEANFRDLVDAISDLNSVLDGASGTRLETFYDLPEKQDDSVSPPRKISGIDQAKAKLQAATDMLRGYKAAVDRCAGLALGPEKVDGDSAIHLCGTALDGAISAGRVEQIALKRKYK